jgi:hypothetical protein
MANTGQQVPQQSWFVQFGIPFGAVGIGLSMMGWTNFWLGLAIASIAYGFLAIDLVRFLRHPKKWQRVAAAIVGAGLYIYFLWNVLVPAPLNVLLAADAANYPVDTDIYGIKWKPHFTELVLVISNDTDTSYTDLDAYIRTDITTQTGALEPGGVNQCSLEASLPGLNIAGAQLTAVETHQSIPLFLNRLTPASIYRLRCPRLASKSRVDARFALVGPAVGKVQARWAKLSTEYDASYRHRSSFFKQCFVANCGELTEIIKE